jgi:hypothetical protein
VQGAGYGGLPWSTGTIKAADYQVAANDVPSIWRGMTDAYFGTNCSKPTSAFTDAADPQVNWNATGGDPAPALDNVAHPGRRQLTTVGLQNCWDKVHQPSSARTQIGLWSPSQSFYMFNSGQREAVAVSIRLDPDKYPSRNIASGGGTTYFCNCLGQWKSISGSVGSSSGSPNGDPVLIFYEGKDGFRLQEKVGSTIRNTFVSPSKGFTVKRGIWLRYLLDVYWSSGSKGAYRLWVDLDGDNVRDFVPAGPKTTAPTILPGYSRNSMNIGPYHKILSDNPKHGIDLGAVEVLSHPASDPW